MPNKQGKKTLGVTVSDSVYSKVKNTAEMKHWSLSQTLALFIDAYWDKWESDLGIELPTPKTRNKTSKKEAKNQDL